MYIDTDKIVTMTAANQNFSAVARQTERDGKSVIFKNNRPKYILIDLDGGEYLCRKAHHEATQGRVSGAGEMTKFSKDKVLLLHQYIASETGGSVGLRDEGLLESALQGAFATYGGRELYPTKEEKAARIGASLVSNHAFLDGNKRIGMYVMLTFLEVNGIRLQCTDEEIVHAGLSLADGSMCYDELLAWIREHVMPQEK